MATYSWYGGQNEFKDTLGNGAAKSGVLRFNNGELVSGNLGTQLFLGFNRPNNSQYPTNFTGNFSDGFDSTKLSCDTTGCSWSAYGVNDETATPISYNISQNNTGASRTINFKYNGITIFSIIQAAYSGGDTTTKKTYTFNAIYQPLVSDTDYALVLVSSTNPYKFTYNTAPLLIDTDNQLFNVFIFNKTNTSDTNGIYATMSQSFRDAYNMQYVSGNNNYYSQNDVYYFNYTTYTANVYDILTKKFTQQQISISDKLELYQVDIASKTCTRINLIQFSDPDFVFTLTY